MGWRVCFFGFNRAPNIDALNDIEWLSAWRLFHEPDTGAWFLEGPSQSDEITFQEEVKTVNPILTAAQEVLLQNIDAQITENDGYKNLFDDYAAKIAMLLSQALKQPVASFVGDDEGVDSCFIFEKGRLVRGRLEIDWNKALAFESSGKAELEWLYPEGVSDQDPDFKNTRTMYQIGIEEADAFFERHTLDDTLSFDRDFKPGQIVLKAQKGEPDPPNRSPTDQLVDELGLDLSPKKVIDACGPVVLAILDKDFPNAPNEHRFELDDRIGAWLLYVGRRQQISSSDTRFNAGLKSFLSELTRYTQRLRPRPEFRKSSIDFRGWNRELRRKWWLNKLRTNLWVRRLLP